MEDQKLESLSVIDRSCKLYHTENCVQNNEPLIICKSCTKSKEFVGYQSCPICGNYLNLTVDPTGRYPVLKCSHCYVEMTGYLKEEPYQIWKRWNLGKSFEKIRNLEKYTTELEAQNKAFQSTYNETGIEVNQLRDKLKIALDAFQKILDSDVQPYDFIYKTLEKIEAIK